MRVLGACLTFRMRRRPWQRRPYRPRVVAGCETPQERRTPRIRCPVLLAWQRTDRRPGRRLLLGPVVPAGGCARLAPGIVVRLMLSGPPGAFSPMLLGAFSPVPLGAFRSFALGTFGPFLLGAVSALQGCSLRRRMPGRNGEPEYIAQRAGVIARHRAPQGED